MNSLGPRSKFVPILLTLLCLAAMPGYAQTPPEAPTAPTAPEPTEPVLADSGQRTRIVVTVPEARVIYRARNDSLEARIADITRQLATLKIHGKEREFKRLQRELERMKEELDLRSLGGEHGIIGLGDIDLQVYNPHAVVPGPVIRRGNDGSIIIGGTKNIRHRKSGDQVGIFDDVYVDENELVEQSAVAIFGDVHVDGYVEGEVVAIFGSVYVSGSVGGDVAAPFGDVYLEDGAEVGGDVTGVEVSVDDLVVIGGKIEEVHLPRLSWMPGENGARSIYLMIATAAVTKAAFSVLLGFLLLGLVPRNIRNVEQRIRTHPVRAFLWGILCQILILPIAAILVVTVIGIPVALLGLPLVISIAMIMGFVAFARILGNALISASDPEGRKWAQYTIGALIIHIPFMFGLAMWSMPAGSEDSPEGFIANMFIWAGLSILYLVSTVGFGAAVTSRLGSRPLMQPQSGGRTASMPSADMPPPPGTSGPSPMPAPPSSGT